MKKRFVYLLVVLCLIFSLTACGSDSSESTSKDSDEKTLASEGVANSSSGTFTLAIDYMPTSLQSSFGSDSITIMTRPIYDPLFQETSEGIEYRLADKLEISDDRKTYSLSLNQDATWSDGEPITSEDIRFSLAYDGYTNGGTSQRTHVNGKPVEVEIIDDKNINLILPEAYNRYIYMLSNTNILPSHAFEGDETKVDGSDYFMTPGMATSGAFEVVEVNQDSFVFEARDDYYRGSLKLEKIVLKLLGSGSTRNVALENGELSYARILSGEQLEKYRSQPEKFNVDILSETRLNAININPFSPIVENLKDPLKARQAIFMALSQEDIIMGAYGSEELARKSNSLFTPEQHMYREEWKGYEYNLEEAKKLAEESGLVGQTLRYIYNKDRAHMEQIAIVVQQQLQQIGVDVVVEGMDNGAFWARYMPSNWEEDQTEWELATNGWDSMRGRSLVQVGSWLTNPRWGWSKEIIELTEACNSETNPEKEQELAEQVHNMSIEECWFYHLPYPNFAMVSHSNVKGLGESEIIPEFGDYLVITVE